MKLMKAFDLTIIRHSKTYWKFTELQLSES